jgi:hypothetical protein
MAFGKRSPAAAMETPSPPAEVRRQISPANLWPDFANEPDDASNFFTDDESVNALIAADRARQEAQLARLSAEAEERTAGGSMRMFFLIPASCWRGDMGDFFMKRLGFSPYGDWNVVFMAADDATARAMDVPIHPGAPIPGTIDLVEQFVRESHERLELAQVAAERSGKPAAFAATEHEVKADVWGLASYLAGKNGVAFRASF